MEFRRAGPDDLPFIMATERLPGYGQFIGRFEDAEHRKNLADPHQAYFVLHQGGQPAGFAIVQRWNTPERVTLLRRIAVPGPGNGTGRVLLRHVLDAIFQQTQAHRVWLNVFVENVRAQRAYEAVGFRAEGIARQCVWVDGQFRDQVVMAILKPEWAAGNGGAVK